MQADVCDSDWHRAVSGDAIDVVVHAAAVTNPRGDEEIARAADSIAVNVGATVNVARWASDVGAGRFVYVSTGSPYGRHLEGSEPLDESAGDDPENVYAITKLAGEQIALRLGNLLKMQVVIARFTSAYGPMERTTPDRAHTSIVHGWFESAMADNEVVVDRRQVPRDYTYIDDVVDAILALAIAPDLRHALYNVSTGLPLGYPEMIAMLAELQPGLRVRYVGETGGGERRPLSISRIRADTGWIPKHDFRAAFRTYHDWLRSAAATV